MMQNLTIVLVCPEGYTCMPDEKTCYHGVNRREDSEGCSCDAARAKVLNFANALHNAEDQASQREAIYEETIRDLTQRLKDAESRASEAERVVNKLQKEVDVLEDELLTENKKYKPISD